MSKSAERATPKVKSEVTDVRVLFAPEYLCVVPSPYLMVMLSSEIANQHHVAAVRAAREYEL
jgi:hypothetical protein